MLPSPKPTIFVGSSRKDLRALPSGARIEIGQALFEVQLGLRPAKAKPLKGFGSGVLEIRDRADGEAYRAVYTVRFETAVYVLHCFQKKSTSGITTPKRHLELIRQRLREAEAIHKTREDGRA